MLIADSEEKLQRLVDVVNEASEQNGLRINTGKTASMVVSKLPNPPRCNIIVNQQLIEQADNFVYLGSTVTQDGRCDVDIRKRIAMAKKMFLKMKNI